MPFNKTHLPIMVGIKSIFWIERKEKKKNEKTRQEKKRKG
jgi:hypothetical protein